MIDQLSIDMTYLDNISPAQTPPSFGSIFTTFVVV